MAASAHRGEQLVNGQPMSTDRATPWTPTFEPFAPAAGTPEHPAAAGAPHAVDGGREQGEGDENADGERARGSERSTAGTAAATAEALSSARLLRPVKQTPRSGWRAALYAASGGLINPGESATDRARRELAERINQRLTGAYRVAAVSVKGGVGKTSTTALLGSTFASLRGDRVIALDANPDRGNLAEKVRSETTATVRHLLADTDQIHSSADVRAYTSQSPARLEVLASESDPEVSRAYDAGEYQATIDLLSRHYNILLTDCGTGLLHSALQAAVEVADSLLIVTSASIDGARAAQATVGWLEAHGFGELVARSVTVITGVRARAGTVDLDAVERYFAAHTRAVVRIPYDRHLDEGAEIHLEQLHPRTRDALLGLAAVVADDFARLVPTVGRARRRSAALLPVTDEPQRP